MLASVSKCGTVLYSAIECGTVLDSAGKRDIDTVGVRATADGGAELAGDPKLDIFTE